MIKIVRLVFCVLLGCCLAQNSLAQTVTGDSLESVPGWWDSVGPLKIISSVAPIQQAEYIDDHQVSLAIEYLARTHLNSSGKRHHLGEWREVINILSWWPRSRQAIESAWKPKFPALLSDRWGVSAEDSNALTGFLFLPSSSGGLEVVRWMETTDRWKALHPEILSFLAGELTEAGDQGRPVMRKMVMVVQDRILGSPAKIQGLSLKTWLHLSAGFKLAEFSPQLGAIWASKIRSAFIEDLDVFQYLTPTQVYSVTAVLSNLAGSDAAKGLAAQWIRNRPLESLQPGEWLALSRAGLFRDDKDPLCRVLLSHLADRYMRDDVSMRELGVKVWSRAAGVANYMDSREREAWAGRIRVAFLNGPDFGKLDRTDATALRDALSRLTGKVDDGEVYASWLAAVDVTKWKRDYAVEVLNRLLVQESAELPPIQAQIQRRRNEFLSSVFAGMDPLSIGSLKRDSVALLVGVVDAMGDRQIGSLVRNQWRLLQDLPMTLGDPAEARALSSATVRLLLRMMTRAKAEERKAIWRETFDDMSQLFLSSGATLSLDSEVMKDFDLLAGAMQDQGLSDTILNDLLEACDGTGKAEVMKRWIWKGLVSIQGPGPVIQTAQSAVQADKDGNSQEAASLYAQVAEQSGEGEPAVLARIRHVWLLLDIDPSADIESNWPSVLEVRPDALRECAWNLSCRSMLRKLASGTINTKAAYDEQIGQIAAAGDNASLYPSTIADLDVCLAKMPSSNASMGLDVLRDLFLMTPDTATMRELQTRRIRLLVQSGQFKDALAAERFAVDLSLGCSQGPSASILQCTNIMTGGGWEPSQAQAFRGGLLFGSPWKQAAPVPGATSRQAESQASGTSVSGETSLQSRAAAILQGDAASFSPRRKAWLYLLAGRTQESLGEAHNAWIMASRGQNATRRWAALEDMNIFLAAADGTIHGYDRFARTWASPQGRPVTGPSQVSAASDGSLSRLVEWHVQRMETASSPSFQSSAPDADRSATADTEAAWSVWDQRLLIWSVQARKAGDNLTAEALGLWETSVAGEGEQSSSRWEERLSRYTSSNKNYGSEEYLRDLLAAAPQALPRFASRIWVKAAQFRFARGDFQGCVEAMDQANAQAGQDKDGEMERNLLGAAANLKLGRHEVALKLLEATRRLKGSDQQHARAFAMKGWTHLDRDEMDLALSAFQEVVGAYPGTQAAVRARQISNRLKTSVEKRP